MTTQDTIMLRHALVAALRAAQAPMTTRELVDRLPWTTERVNAGCRVLAAAAAVEPAAMKVVQCHASWHVVGRARTCHAVYKQLRSLAKRGVVQHIPVNGRLVRWRYLGDDATTD